MTDCLLRENQGRICVLTLNTPKSLNALSETMLAALQNQLDDIATSKDIRVVVLRAMGKAFCAGHDLKEMTAARAADDGGHQYFLDLFATCSRMMKSIRDLPQPVIAQVHGLATAAGCQLVATCDLAVAEDQTKFGVNGVNIGLFCSTPMVALSRNMPRKKVFELLTTGEFMDTATAQDFGLINKSVPASDLEQATMDMATTIASKLSSAVKVGKRAFYEQIEMTVDEAYDHTGKAMAQNMMARNTEEGIAAFIDKRKPDWAD